MGTPLAISANYSSTGLHASQPRPDFTSGGVGKPPVVSGMEYSSVSGANVESGLTGGGGRRRTSSSSGPPLNDQGEMAALLTSSVHIHMYICMYTHVLYMHGGAR